MIKLLRDWLIEPRVRGLDPDSEAFSLQHREILMSKPLVRQLFLGFYRRCRTLDERLFTARGARLEIGSGSSFVREAYPDVVTSDIKFLPFVDLICRGEALPVRDASLRAVYAINTFHHIPEPRRFLREMTRALAPGGGVILIEPYHGPLARFLFRRMHASEGFDEHAASWEAPDGAGPFTKANQALSYIVFRRDRATFESEFPGLTIALEQPHTHLSYVVSGGVNFRQLVPTFASPLVAAAEWMLSPLDRIIALQHTVVLRRL